MAGCRGLCAYYDRHCKGAGALQPVEPDPVDTPFTRANPSLALAQWLDPIETRHTQSAARALGLRLLVFNAVDTDLSTVFATLVEHQAGGIVVGGNVFLWGKNAQIACGSLCATHHVSLQLFGTGGRAFELRTGWQWNRSANGRIYRPHS
jgi:hypothetical protein